MRQLLALFTVLLAAFSSARGSDFEREPILYSAATPDNVISRLQQRLNEGKESLAFDPDKGYLPAVLKALKVPISSQTLVFSKTSLQRHRIGPRMPRALFFNDDVYVGHCQKGDVVEISAVDSKLGTVFYTLDQESSAKPTFTRQTDNCLQCHASSQTRGVPGHLVRSVFPDVHGMPILSAGTYRVDQTTPLERRWGGWYVTGQHGNQTHLGNFIVRGREVARPVDNASGMNLADLGERFPRSNYLSPHSDIVALMVLEHQAEAHNLLTRANFEGRAALHMEETLNREMKAAPGYQWDSTRVRIRSVADALVDYFLFREEAPLTDKIQGSSDFSREFARQGPRDRKGRSLRDLDLTRRLFRYPMSYLIYSPSFDALPDRVREQVWERLDAILSGKDNRKEYAHLSAEDRQAIREILADTRTGTPASWKK